MVANQIKRDQWGRRHITEDELVKHIYEHPSDPLLDVTLDNPYQYNAAIDLTFSELQKFSELEELTILPEEWHKRNQANWHMPDEYKNLDIASWILTQCNGNETELQRCGEELLEYAQRDLLPLLCYLKYLVDTMRQKNVVWGVGRGSSVASFVLYKIGIHKINSITYELDFKEFMR